MKILIANRGEIALRIGRACRDLGIPSVAVYSDADRLARHVLAADEALHLGPAPAAESYLHIPRIIAAARASGATAIHPGYGFLSENPAFARACRDAGLVFIGPSPEAMEQLGDKIAARQLAAAHDVPVLPGVLEPLPDARAARRAAAAIGYPVLLKASAGGGGKGMRRVEAEAELDAAFQLVSSEAERAFADGRVYLERALDHPRHVEIQLLADAHGHAIYLGERECSIQRRHQKIVEEAPALRLAPAIRQAMGTAALRLARAAGYANAGTAEFLLDPAGQFYFLEMNTRLQVEHPVTELVFGRDLVTAQIRIAAGEKLAWQQADLEPRGHAIECRIYAEDPDQNFMPSPGRITHLLWPEGPGIRLDSGIYEGWTVPLDYDPLLAKLIVWGEDRAQAAARLRRALDECEIGGLRHNLGFFRRLVREPDFLAGTFDTGFAARFQAGVQSAAAPDPALPMAAIAAVLAAQASATPAPSPGIDSAPGPSSKWRAANFWTGHL